MELHLLNIDIRLNMLAKVYIISLGNLGFAILFLLLALMSVGRCSSNDGLNGIDPGTGIGENRPIIKEP